MSPFFRPSASSASHAVGDVSLHTGTKELSYGGLSAGVEKSLNQPGDVQSAHQFFKTAGQSSVVPASEVAHSAAAGHATIGNAAIGHGAMLAAVPGGEPISPLIQLIMRLPGATGIAHSFFEWLAHMFAPGAHDLMSGFDPSALLHNGIGAHLLDLHSLAQTGIEHLAAGMHSLPVDSSLIDSLGNSAGHGLNLLDISHSSPPVADHFLQDPANLGAPADPSQAAFEQAVPSHGGLLAGPNLSHSSVSNFISGNQRMFSDQLAGGGNFNTVTSAANVPNAATLPANSSGVTFGQEVNQVQIPRASDSALSGPAMKGTGLPTEAKVDQVADNSSAATAENGSGTTMTQQYGSNNVISSDVPSAFGHPRAGFEGASASGDVQPLTAKGLTYADMKAGAGSHVGAAANNGLDHVGSQVRSTFDHISHQAKNVIDSIQHQVHSAAPQQNLDTDSIAQPHMPQSYPSDVSTKSAVSSDGAAVNHATHASRAVSPGASSAQMSKQIASAPHVHHHAAHHSPKIAESQQSAVHTNDAGSSSEQTNANLEQTNGSPDHANASSDQTSAGTDQTNSDYTVHRGDSLWEIAQKNLGDGSRWGEIYKLNSDSIGSNPDLIFSGTDLKMPTIDGNAVADASKYVVQPGDNLWNIAKSHMGDGKNWGEIYHANSDVIGGDPRLITPGEQLNLPSGASHTIAQDSTTGASMSAGHAAPTHVAHNVAHHAAHHTIASASQSAGAGGQSGAGASDASSAHSGGAPAVHHPHGAHHVSYEQGISANQADSATAQQLPSESGVTAAASSAGATGTTATTGAAALKSHVHPVVSSSLAPDLSFLQQKSQ